MYSIVLQGITKKYSDKTILDNCDFSVEKGSFTMVFGESGSGKSTLLNIISLTDKPSSGTAFIDGIKVDFNNSKKMERMRKEKIGIVFQMYHLIPHLTVKENIMMPFLYHKIISQNETNSLLENTLCAFGMEKKVNQAVELLSGGEKQRTAITRAIITQPQILICDEPTGNLDDNNTISIMNGLKMISNKGTTIVMVTHNRNLINYSDNAFELKNGKLFSIKNV